LETHAIEIKNRVFYVFKQIFKIWCQVCIVKHMRDIKTPICGMTQNKPVE